MVDGTYKINNVGMSLYDILVEDGCGDSRVIAYCFVAQETKISIVNFLQIFKRYNPKWEQIKVAITDKDFTEIVSIKKEFPQAINLLCQFHMLKYIRTKISSYSSDNEVKEQLMQLTKKAVYALSEQQLSDTFKDIEKLSTDFHRYMVKNWLSCKESWCMYQQKDVFTMFNSTTNRIEAHHRVLKLHLKSSSSFSWNLERLLIILDQHAHVVSHKEFVEKMYTTVNTSQLSANLQPFFQYCTGYAAHKVAEEYKKSITKKYQIVDGSDGYKVHGAIVYDIPKLLSSCSCLFFSTMQLPCRHLLFILVQQNKNIFNKEMIAERWTKQYNTYSDVADFVKNEHDVEVDLDVMKYSEVSPCKKQKMSRHQKYQELMLLCKDFCDISCDLPHRDYNMIYNFIKYTTQTIRNGKTVIVKEMSQMINNDDQKCKDIDLAIPEGVATNQDVTIGELPCENIQANGEMTNSENEHGVVINDKDKPKDVEEIQDGLASNRLIEEDIQGVKNDKEEGIHMQEVKIDKEERMQEIEEEPLCKMDNGSHVKHANRSTELSQTQEIKEINIEYHQSKCDPSSLSYLIKHLPNQNLEVLKSVHL